MGLRLFTEVLDVLERHGYARGDAGRAIFLIRDLAGIYEGSQDHPFGPSSSQPPPRTETGACRPRPPRTPPPCRSARSRPFCAPWT
jgi:hypothetical protein